MMVYLGVCTREVHTTIKRSEATLVVVRETSPQVVEATIAPSIQVIPIACMATKN